MDQLAAFQFGQAIAAGSELGAQDALIRQLQANLDAAIDASYGQAAIKDSALAEIRKLDPNHWLLLEENRKRLYSEAVAARSGTAAAGRN